MKKMNLVLLYLTFDHYRGNNKIGTFYFKFSIYLLSNTEITCDSNTSLCIRSYLNT